MVGPDISMGNGTTLLCIKGYHNKFPIVKTLKSLSADNLVQMAKLVFGKIQTSKEDCFR